MSFNVTDFKLPSGDFTKKNFNHRNLAFQSKTFRSKLVLSILQSHLLSVIPLSNQR